MGAPGCDDMIDFGGFVEQGLFEMPEPRNQILGDGQIGAEVNGRGDHIIAALPHVDMVVGMDRCPQILGGQICDHLIGIHIGAGARSPSGKYPGGTDRRTAHLQLPWRPF